MSQTVKDLYFGHEEISKDTLKQLIKLSGDHMFFGGTEVVVRELVKHSQGEVPTYRYMVGYVVLKFVRKNYQDLSFEHSHSRDNSRICSLM